MRAEYTRNRRVDVSRVGRRAVLYHRDSREAVVLNPTGSWLWDQLSSQRTADELAAAMQRHYGLPPDQASHEVDQFLAELRSHDAIVGV
ncbi:MAG TPA: PqqD family protein [Gaiellales bacterium]|nr:PqqD family protein [Gaiellales bacterium]